MVSLAFVISFVASAVALLLGIVIYSDIQDDLVGTFEVFPEVTIPEVTQNLGQNTATSDQIIPANTTNLASVYSGVNNTSFITEVTVPISGVNIGLTLDGDWFATNHKFCNTGSGANGCDYQPFALSTNANGYNSIGLTGGGVPSASDAYQKRGESIMFKTFDKSDLDGKTLDIDWNGFNFGTGAGLCTGVQSVAIYDGAYSISDGGVADFPDGSPFALKSAGLLQTMNTQSCILGVGGTWSFDGVSATIDLSSSTDPSNQVTLMFIIVDNDSSNNTNQQAPYMIVTDLTLNTGGGSIVWDFTSTGSATYTEDNPTTCVKNCGLVDSLDPAPTGATLPFAYEIGLFDSSNNLLSSQTGSITNDTAQNLIATYPNIPVPNDGTVSIGIYGDGINYLGDTTLADFSNDIGSIEDPFISDGTSASSQRTILQITTAEIIIPESGGANPEFIQANSIALTVLGVMPVALFFALFTILSPRVDGEA